MKTAYYSLEEFSKVYKELGISEEDYESCKLDVHAYRSRIELRETYTFTHLSLINEVMNESVNSHLVLIVKKDELYFVELQDESHTSRDDYNVALARCTGNNNNIESLIVAYFDTILRDDFTMVETGYKEISKLEQSIAADEYSEDFNKDLLETKRYLLMVKNYYDQLIDVLEAFEDNYNEILEDSRVKYISSMLRKVNRLTSDNNTLIDLLAQLQTTYSAHLDSKMNSTMKLLTIITTVFMPLTLIVGWYGMNFVTMPELQWSHGYIYVILLSITLSLSVVVIAKVKKWF